ncbi:UNVERIFIED_CONTAM: TLC domain-containing protein 4 B [Sesamum latifolium]|uniref:TLC domain-containing protein 4 B n=1 Tax=Sesamum latifolium TaxID=2727402 RepID=A0AAW2WLU4_9LAMI
MLNLVTLSLFHSGISTLHAVFISIMSMYFVFWSELFADHNSAGLITLRNSPLSTFVLGMSVGYFVSDLGMICWLYPSLGGAEYIVHHSLSGIAVAYSMFTGEGQLYTFMVLISEVTTPEINMRWYLDMAGLKKSSAYLINGVMIFFGGENSFVCLHVYHVYLHHTQVMQMHTVGFLLVFSVPLALAIMNLLWFGKILKGLKKTLGKRK